MTNDNTLETFDAVEEYEGELGGDDQFYPTPPELAKKLFDMLAKKPQAPILEPSAGTGDLVKAFNSYNRYSTKFKDCWGCPCLDWSGDTLSKDIDLIEVDADRAAILKEKYRVIWDNFLTFNPLTPYYTIIMNPPFNAGVYHLLKAIDILAPGGQIACILNAETIKNPYSRARQELIKRLENGAEYRVEYVQDAFKSLGVNVEVALVYYRKKPDLNNSVTFDNFKKTVDDIYSAEGVNDNAADEGGFEGTQNLIRKYRAEVKATLALYDECKKFNAAIKNLNCVDTEIFDVKFSFSGYNSPHEIIFKINKKYWTLLLYSRELERLLTSEAREKYLNKLHVMKHYEFNERNIFALKEDLIKSFGNAIDKAIMDVWEAFTCRHSMEEYSNNIHYYNGWKHNSAFKCNSTVIIPYQAFYDEIISTGFYNKRLGRYSTKTFKTFRPSKVDRWKNEYDLSDVEKAMYYILNRRPFDCDFWSYVRVTNPDAADISKCLESEHFTFKFYKKGTCHLTFKSPELLKKFNLYCGKRFNWLPDDYGRKPYSDLTPDEKAVADSFEGEESYNDTYKNQNFYLTLTPPNLPALNAPNENN